MKKETLVRDFTDQELSGVLDEMQADDVTDMLEEMPANVVRKVLSRATLQDRREINELLKYPEDSAGGVMTTEYVRLREDMTVSEALAGSGKTGTTARTSIPATSSPQGRS